MADDMDLAHRLADAAGAAILPFFRADGGLHADSKDGAGFDPVTEGDRAAERAMRDILARDRPEDGILGEEFGHVPGTSGREWVLDPIDGTRGFLSGTPTWGVLIALTEGGEPVLGVIDQPYTRERFSGGPGVADMTGPLGPRPLRTRSTASLSDAIMFSTFPEIGTAEEKAAFDRVLPKVKLTRYGTDCYAYALIAAGQIDLVIEAGLKPYDVMAPIAVVTAAGGRVTDWEGNPATGGGRVLAAANPEIHAQALALLAS